MGEQLVLLTTQRSLILHNISARTYRRILIDDDFGARSRSVGVLKMKQS